MDLAKHIDFAALMEPVALRLLGEPNPRLSKPPRELRFGNHDPCLSIARRADSSITKTTSAAALSI